ncbi:MAG: hypothetical protein U5N86_00075 [Planctomycetota bacterium]|nr:hypothetical protein [Planctomycetota bacterium]
MRSELKRYYDVSYEGFRLPGFKTMSLYKVLARLVQLFHEGTPVYRLKAVEPDKMVEILLAELQHDENAKEKARVLLRKWLGKRLLLEREDQDMGPNPIHYKTASMLDAATFDDEGTSVLFYRILSSDRYLRRAFHRYFSPRKDDNAEEELLVRLATRLPLEVDENPKPDASGEASICPAFERLVIDDFKRVFAYADSVSRGTFVGLLENLVGLHLATYEMLVTNIVNNFVKRSFYCPEKCPVAEDAGDLKGCHCVDGVFASADRTLESVCQVAVRSFVSKIEKYRNYQYNLAYLRKLEQFNADGREYLKEQEFKLEPTPQELLELREHPDLRSWFEAEAMILSEEETNGRRISFSMLDEAKIDAGVRHLSKVLSVLAPKKDSEYLHRLERLLGYGDGFGLLSSFRGSFMYYLSDAFLGFTIMLATVEKNKSGRYDHSVNMSLGDFCNFLRQRYGVNVGGRYKGGNPSQDILEENIAILHRRLFYMGYVLDPLNRPINPTIRPNIVIKKD